MMWPVLFGLSGALFDRLFEQFDYMEPFRPAGIRRNERDLAK